MVARDPSLLPFPDRLRSRRLSLRKPLTQATKLDPDQSGSCHPTDIAPIFSLSLVLARSETGNNHPGRLSHLTPARNTAPKRLQSPSSASLIQAMTALGYMLSPYTLFGWTMRIFIFAPRVFSPPPPFPQAARQRARNCRKAVIGERTLGPSEGWMSWELLRLLWVPSIRAL